MSRIKFFSLLMVVAFFFSCQKNPNDSGVIGEELNGKVAPDQFNFSTFKTVSVSLRLLTNSNKPLKGVPVLIYTTKNDTLFKDVSDNDGYIKGSIQVPSHFDKVIIDPNYIGLADQLETSVSAGLINAVIGGTAGFSDNLTPFVVSNDGRSMVKMSAIPTISANNNSGNNTIYQYMGEYDNTGRPKYLMTPDVISQGFLDHINNSLPEKKNGVQLDHPEYLAADVPEALRIIKKSKVYVTFLHEGASYSNVLGYYTYNTNKAPESPDDIGKITYIFPNASVLANGGIKAGDKVFLGEFSANTSIGFVLLANGWNASKKEVNSSALKFYTDSKLNPEESKSARKHTVLLSYKPEYKFVIGFEDILRGNNSSSDHDFNDLVFYAKADPVDGIDDTGIPDMVLDDCDNDGVLDASDEFPCDPERATTTQGSWGTLAFEDNWPLKGDYDMNDLVVNYRYKQTKNASGKVVEIDGEFKVAAAGASFSNGFGVQFDFAPSNIKEVTGHRIVGNSISLSSNGTEAGQGKAVVIPFDNARSLFSVAGNSFINTEMAATKLESELLQIHIKFTTPIAPSVLGNAPFNPFLISNQRRGYEIHLPGQLPSDKADVTLFGTGDDNSGNGKYYQSALNWPWALNLSGTFDHPIEREVISKGYLHFLEWAESSGSKFPDWYVNTEEGFRNNSFLYRK